MSTFAQVGSVDLAPSVPLLTAVDPYANAESSPDNLKPARRFWYSVNAQGISILRLDDNFVVSTVPWPATIDLVQPDGEFVNVAAPVTGWEPVAMTVSYPTDEALASSSETPATYVFVVMARSGFEWQTNLTPPAGQDLNVRDTLVPATSAATESSMLVQLDVTDPTFSAAPPAFAAAILGHGAGQPAFDPSTGSVYVGNMPSLSLPTSPAVPNDLTSFVSIIAAMAPPAAEAGGGEVPGAPEPPMVVICGPEHPTDGTLAGVPVAWACVSSGDGPSVWEFQDLPSWLIAHPDKVTGQLDGILYGTPVVGTYTFQARVTDYADPVAGPLTSEWATFELVVTTTAPSEEGEGGFEAGVAGAQALTGTGTCDLAPTASLGSLVPAWVDAVAVPNGCVVMGTAPISGESYEFAMPNFQFAYPYDREPVIFSGNVAGPYVFDPLPAGVGLSGLAWHEIEKIHDPSTEADILNVEFIGVEPFTGQLYRILPPQGAPEGGGGGEAVGPPETSIERDAITTEGTPLGAFLTGARADIANVLSANPGLSVRFGEVAVQANRDIFVGAVQLADPTGANAAVIPIGGPAGSAISIGALIKVSSGTASTVDLAGVQAFSLGLDSDLRPAVLGVDPGQVDNGALFATGTTSGNVAVVDTAAGVNVQSLAVIGAAALGGVCFNPATQLAYVAGKSLQNVLIFGAGPVTPPNTAPVIFAPIEATFMVGVPGSYTILTTGWPTPSVAELGVLPAGLTFVDNLNGTATLSGTPAAGTEATYTLTLRASNSEGIVTQPLTLIVDPPPAAPLITSAASTHFDIGVPGSFMVTSSGGPVPSLTVAETLPAWLTFTDNEDGTATLAGTPPVGSDGYYPLTITASNGTLPDAIQNFVLAVGSAVPTCTTGQWTAEYFANATLTGSPAGVLCESAIDHDWGNSGPGVAGVGADNFSVRWTQTIDFGAGGTYTLRATGDDGIRVFVDGTLEIDGWKDQPPTTYTADVALDAGTHTIVVEYYEKTLGAIAQFSYAPAMALDCGTLWKAEYFANMTLTGTPAGAECESAINYNWGSGGPAGAIRVGNNNFSARWTQVHDFGAGGQYLFTAIGDDGIRVFLDGAPVIDGWKDQPPTTYTAIVPVGAGSHTIVVEYYDKTGGAVAQFSYVPYPVDCGAQWTAEYFANTTLAGSPSTTQCESAINYNWGGGKPIGVAVGPDRFSARWTQVHDFGAGGQYLFSATGDDGIRVSLDGTLVIDGWKDQPPTAYEAVVAVGSGVHTIVVEYYENTGGAVAQFSYVAYPLGCGTGWMAEYFANMDLSGSPAATLCEAAVDHNWGAGGPAGVGTDHFSARWTQVHDFGAGGTYTFTATADDGIRVLLDGVAIIDHWIDEPPTTYNVSVAVSGGAHTIVVEYYENTIGAVAQVSYAPAL